MTIKRLIGAFFILMAIVYGIVETFLYGDDPDLKKQIYCIFGVFLIMLECGLYLIQ